jgi:hypothetical protein
LIPQEDKAFRDQYLRHLSGIDSVVNPPKCSHMGHH